MQLTKALRAKVAIEFGTVYGNTAANLCLAGVERVITVNALPEQTSGVTRTFDLTESEIGCVYRKHGYERQVTQLLCNTLEVNLQESIPESSADIAIVDACHDYDFVIRDFLKVAPFIRPGGSSCCTTRNPRNGDTWLPAIGRVCICDAAGMTFVTWRARGGASGSGWRGR